MRLKRYIAPTMTDALKLIKSELGPDAVILATRKIKGEDGKTSLEITAAVDKPLAENKPSAATERLLEHTLRAPVEMPAPYSLAGLLQAHGLLPQVCDRITRAVTALMDTGFNEEDGLEMVLSKLIPFRQSIDVLPKGHVLMLVGPTGAGKTTTLAKLAVRQRMAGHTVGLITLDTYKIGGIEQLGIYADALKESLHVAKTSEELDAALQACANVDHIFIDTAGINPFEQSRLADLAMRLEGRNVDVAVVLPANLNAAELTTLPRAFKKLAPRHLILSKLDETAHLGGVINAAVESGLSICLAADGQRVPQDLIELDAASLARRLLSRPRLPWEDLQEAKGS